MEFEIIQHKHCALAILREEKEKISNAHQAAELLINCSYQGSDCLVAWAEQFHPDFFVLKTRLAGDILQQFSTYGGRLAIIGQFTEVESTSLRDFIRESNRGKRINFVNTYEEALEVLSA